MATSPVRTTRRPYNCRRAACMAQPRVGHGPFDGGQGGGVEGTRQEAIDVRQLRQRLIRLPSQLAGPGNAADKSKGEPERQDVGECRQGGHVAENARPYTVLHEQ